MATLIIDNREELIDLKAKKCILIDIKHVFKVVHVI